MTDLGELGPVDVETGESPKPAIIVACESALADQHNLLVFLVSAVGFPVLLREDCDYDDCSIGCLVDTLCAIEGQADLISLAAHTLVKGLLG